MYEVNYLRHHLPLRALLQSTGWLRNTGVELLPTREWCVPLQDSHDCGSTVPRHKERWVNYHSPAPPSLRKQNKMGSIRLGEDD